MYNKRKSRINETLRDYEPKSMHDNLPVIWNKGKGCYIYDEKNKQYLDFTSGIFVASVGHNNKKVVEAIKEQADKLLHSYTFATEIRARFLFKLIQVTPKFCDKAFLLSSGTESTDCAVKLMRNFTHKEVIVSFKGAMHGKTMCAEKMRGKNENNEWAISHDPDFYHLPFPSNESNFKSDISELLQKRGEKDIAGFMIEGYQGWSASFYPKFYINDLMNFAKKNNILVCFDEIQSGIGRTGKLFCYEHYNIEPDLLCIGKGLGGGLPISAVIGRKNIIDSAIDLSSTQSGNPICCAAGLAVLDQIEELIKNVQWQGLFLDSGLRIISEKYPKYIKKVNCKGLVGAIIFNTTEQANKVVQKAFEKGLLLVKTGRESIKIGPPLIITTIELYKGINIIDDCIKETLGKE